MTQLIAQKKENKRRALLDSAYKLFSEKGVSQTSIAEICKGAGIAKGTFYLYFKDKEDILRALTAKISSTILDRAYAKIKDKSADLVASANDMADYLMDLFKNEPDLVKILKKDFVWPISEVDFITSDNPTMKAIREKIISFSKETGISEHQILVRLYSLLSMICSVSYSAIIDHFPGNLDSMRSEIHAMISGAFGQTA